MMVSPALGSHHLSQLPSWFGGLVVWIGALEVRGGVLVALYKNMGLKCKSLNLQPKPMQGYPTLCFLQEKIHFLGVVPKTIQMNPGCFGCPWSLGFDKYPLLGKPLTQ